MKAVIYTYEGLEVIDAKEIDLDVTGLNSLDIEKLLENENQIIEF